MNLYKNCVSAVLLLAVFASVCSASDAGFLNVTCNEASDCYLLEDKGLSLSCSFDVHKGPFINYVTHCLHRLSMS